MKPIRLEEQIQYACNNEGVDATAYGDLLRRMVAVKAAGGRCKQCGAPMWAVGSAAAGSEGCVRCLTDETDDSDVFEIDSVCPNKTK